MLAPWAVVWCLVPCFHLATPGTFPTEERFSLKERIRKCLIPKWFFWLFCSLRRLRVVNGRFFSGTVHACLQGTTYINQGFSQEGLELHALSFFSPIKNTAEEIF